MTLLSATRYRAVLNKDSRAVILSPDGQPVKVYSGYRCYQRAVEAAAKLTIREFLRAN